MSNPGLVRKISNSLTGEAGEIQYDDVNLLAKNMISSSKNLIINSNLEFWQRGTNFTGLGANQVYTADRLQWAGGTLTATLSGTRVAITGANSSIIPTRIIPWAIRYGVSVAQPSLAAGASAGPWMKIEGYDIAPLAQAGNTGFTFSFYTRAFRPGVYNVQFFNGAQTRNYATTFTISVADTWQRVVIKVPFLDVGNGVWNFSNGIGMYMRIWMASGTDYLGVTPNVWSAAGVTQITSTQVNAVQSTSDYLELTGFMLHTGQEERDFATREDSVTKELQLCQRYYEKSYELDVAPGSTIFAGSESLSITATIVNLGSYPKIQYKVRKRAVAALTPYSVTGVVNTLTSGDGVTLLASGSVTLGSAFDTGARVSNQSGLLAVPPFNTAYYQWAADAEL